jgi:hypothetical protein
MRCALITDGMIFFYFLNVKKKTSDIIPQQQTGKAIDAASSIELNDESDAKTFFTKVRDRLQNVNQWKKYAGSISADFQLVDNLGRAVWRQAREGDYFKIDIPGPGSKNGDGYDWVKIEEVVSSSSPNGESFGFRVRPADNPQRSNADVAHFYSQESTSTFIVERNKNKITVSIHDRNTKPNTNADRTSDKIRDTLVGAAGVITFSKIQWKNLTEGLLNP